MQLSDEDRFGRARRLVGGGAWRVCRRRCESCADLPRGYFWSMARSAFARFRHGGGASGGFIGFDDGKIERVWHPLEIGCCRLPRLVIAVRGEGSTLRAVRLTPGAITRCGPGEQ